VLATARRWKTFLIDSSGLVMAGVAVLDRVAQDGVRVRASAGAASFAGIRPWKIARRKRRKRYAVFQEKPRGDPCAASRREAAARLRRPVIPSAGSRNADRSRANCNGQHKTGRDAARSGRSGKKQISRLAAGESEPEKETRPTREKEPRASTLRDPEARVMKMADGDFPPA